MPEAQDNMRTQLVITCLLLLSAAAAWGRDKTDVIVMQNGDRLTGEILKLQDGVLSLNIDYVQSNVLLEWEKVARVESKQLFVVLTQDGSTYRGTLKTPETAQGAPVKIEIVESPTSEVAMERPQIVEMGRTSGEFWRRFSGNVYSGTIYSKGNDTTQYNIGTQFTYRRERWEADAAAVSALSNSSGSTASTRNQFSLGGQHLLSRRDWFYSGMLSFLQSTQQGIDVQTIVGGGLGRILKNTAHSRVSLLGGLAWQGTEYSSAVSDRQLAGLVGGSVQLFKFSKTNLNLKATLFPALTEPGRVRFYTNASYSIQVFGNLSWTISFYGNWDNRPPAGLSGSDYGTSAGLTWNIN
jgi:hypothetical protein